ncbi:MAG TPA: nicotinate-nucleotide adenylyltransferase [Candidatus Kapabacteria bacterium]|nr:nicotinate-nucleotide adenylyltransferase [Candidatus Kapabacteria bacterium]
MSNSTHQRLLAARSIGLFGGTFDPVHLGHLLLAECAAEVLALDLMLFMPAYIPPHKRNGRAITPAEHRLEMLLRAVQGNPRFAVSTHEIDAGGASYTVETLKWMRAAYANLEPVLLIGGDSARDFHTWYRPDEIARLARLVVVARSGAELPAELIPGVALERVDAPLVDISSTDIRERFADGRSVRYRLPDSVIDYINQHGIYR